LRLLDLTLFACSPTHIAMVEAELNKENEEEPCFDDPAGFLDDIDDEELVGDVLKQQPFIREYENNAILVFGLPAVGPERLGKLKNVLKKIFDNVNSGNNFEVPVDDAGATRGVCFVEWPDRATAEYACNVLDGYKLDKNHTFQTILYSNTKQISKPDESWENPEPQPYQDIGDAWSWMHNSRCRDQFAIQYEKNGCQTVSVMWNIKGHDPEVAGDAERPSWTESVFRWSPHGSFLTTIHSRGIVMWGGEKFTRYRRFTHDNVQFIDFSPNENFLVTYAPSGGRWGEDEDCLRIWNVFTGEQLKGFSLYALTNRDQLPCWPFFCWSHDERYFACAKAPEKDRLEKEKKVNGISIYDSATMDLLGRRSIIIDNLKSFSWNPARNILAYYSEGDENTPAEFGLLEVPSGQKLRTARIYNVAEAQMWWQESGMRLAIHTQRFQKKATKENGDVKYIGGTTSHIEIFDLSDKKDVSQMNIPLKEPFVSLGWEPHGDKLCVLTGNAAKCQPLVYRMDPTKHAPVPMSKLDPVPQLNAVEWAPAGGWLAVLARLSTGGNIVFVDASGAEAKRSNVAEHPGFNKGYWDPTGRYFVTCCTQGGRAGADLGYRIYTFQGRELVRKNLERLLQFKWRPRPPVKLPEQKLKEIKKNLKTTSVKFDREDNDEKVKASQEVIDKRRKIMSAFDLVRHRNVDMITSMRGKRIELRDGVDTDDMSLKNDDLVEEKITVALSTQRTRTTSGEGEDGDE
ncbi:hypothetical protein PFISCL1PPCAC_5779, partial [Pristionchus fissidentatus]